MSMLIDRFIPGLPVSQPRPRARAVKIRGFWTAMMYDCGSSNEWKKTIIDDLVKAKLKPTTPHEGALRLDLVFYMPRPASRNRKKDPAGEIPHLGRPDVDNLFKAVADCLKAANFIAEDSLICDSRIQKFYHAKGKSPGVDLRLSRWEPEQSVGMIHMEVGEA